MDYLIFHISFRITVLNSALFIAVKIVQFESIHYGAPSNIKKNKNDIPTNITQIINSCISNQLKFDLKIATLELIH